EWQSKKDLNFMMTLEQATIKARILIIMLQKAFD
ncbi:hypothetical protein CP02DC14_1685, partial [Chlamydia psittaci 02DC14]